ncbi:polysaccharide deacetylase family protein [Nostoc sp. CENA67]|uniref:Polysaccharide deacetylase family protein n=1 Tax=Amazonocrinis nigriterrae CENA67 TaxID=2794033 RepID=A0A8J7HJK4_9NOST|nr:polysaccharide deacetylase family protein [Amazonocrinis nigriterrae CENA67]
MSFWNSNVADNNLKRQRIFGVVAIAFSVTACSIAPGIHPRLQADPVTSQLHAVQIPNHPANSKVNSQLLPSAKVENLSFAVPDKFQGKTVYQVHPSSNEKLIALTIDDGPWPNTTSQMLDILKQNDVKATFFWVGQALQANPELAKRVVTEGHAIGNHTWHHWYRRMDEATAKSEIERTADLIYKTTGVKTSLFRPPGGFLNNGLAAYAKSQKNTVVMWSLTSADTDPHAKPQAFVNNVLKGAKPGAIVLMHDGGGDRQRTVQALPQIITGLKQQGYRFVTIPELLKIAP